MITKTATAQTRKAAILYTPTSLNVFEGNPNTPEPITPLMTSNTIAHMLILRLALGKDREKLNGMGLWRHDQRLHFGVKRN